MSIVNLSDLERNVFAQVEIKMGIIKIPAKLDNGETINAVAQAFVHILHVYNFDR